MVSSRAVHFRAPDPALTSLGITNQNIVRNPTVSEIYEYAMLPELKSSFDPKVRDTRLSSTGALVNYSGKRTGRSPKDKRTVLDKHTKDRVWWGDVNMPLSPVAYEVNRARAVDYLNTRPYVFVIDGWAGWDPLYKLKCRVICNRPYHALFMKQMMIRPTPQQIEEDFKEGADVNIINGGEFHADPNTESVTNETCVSVNYSRNEIAILGSQYAGEMKKGLFGVMHYNMPQQGVLSMHASANEGIKGDVTVLFGLSGTGKTTLSADPHRKLIGDDEHCWTDHGVFNIEGGCYAKAINLSAELEPEIFNSIKFGSVLENIMFEHDQPGNVDYGNTELTENTRVAYPLEHMPNVKIPAMGGHPKNIIYLTCDAYGVLPPVAKLTREQIMYHFVSGYTAKVAGTEMGVTEPQVTFSACFGEAFLPLHPYTYAEMLADLVEKHEANVWLINTGWTGGAYGTGKRMSLKNTRSILDAIHEGEMEEASFKTLPIFNLSIPESLKAVPDQILNPRNTWTDKDAFADTCKKLGAKFIENMKKYEDKVPKEVVNMGGPTLD